MISNSLPELKVLSVCKDDAETQGNAESRNAMRLSLRIC